MSCCGTKTRDVRTTQQVCSKPNEESDNENGNHL